MSFYLDHYKIVVRDQVRVLHQQIKQAGTLDFDAIRNHALIVFQLSDQIVSACELVGEEGEKIVPVDPEIFMTLVKSLAALSSEVVAIEAHMAENSAPDYRWLRIHAAFVVQICDHLVPHHGLDNPSPEAAERVCRCRPSD